MTLSEKWAGLKQKLGLRKSGINPPEYSNICSDGGASKLEPDPYAGLSEVAAPPPVQNRDESAHVYEHHTLEEERR